MDRVAPHIVGERHELKIFDGAIGAIPIFECDDVSFWDWSVVLHPHVAIEQRPDLHVAESVRLALGPFAHFDSKKSLTVGENGSDWTPVPCREARPLTFFELGCRHASGRITRPAQSLVHRHIPFWVAMCHARDSQASAFFLMLTFEIRGVLVYAQFPRTLMRREN